jgi:hypothetical protein
MLVLFCPSITPTDKLKNSLIKKYHVLVRDAKISDEDKLVLLSNWKVTSSKDLNVSQLNEVCDFLEKMIDPEKAELEKWRDWTVTCVKAYGKASGANYSDEYAEGIICTATRIDNFKDISKKRLQGIYNQFKKSKNDAVLAHQIIIEDIQAFSALN